jgi:hypothetical protein
LIRHAEGEDVVIKAYFDESEREDGTFCIASYCYFPGKAEKLDKLWRKIMGGKIFHATDMNNRAGDFKGLDPSVSAQMYHKLIDAILKHAEFGVVLSINPRDVTVEWPGLDGFKTAYALCCTLIVSSISSHLDRLGIKSRVAYIFEDGHRYKSEVERFMNSVSLSSNRYHYLSHSFVPKDGAILLQTADLLAWEWGKYISEFSQKMSMRRSLEELLLRDRCKHIVGNPSKRDLEEDLAKFRTMEEMVRSAPDASAFLKKFNQKKKDGQ